MKKNLYIMYLISFLQGLVFYAPVSLLFRIERGLSLSQFFFLEFFLLVVMVLLEIPWGYFADKYGYKKTLVISYTLFFLARTMLLFSNSFTDFLFQSILTSTAVSGLSGCDIAFLYSSVDKSECEKVFGKYNSYSKLGFFISALSSIFIITNSIKSMEIAVFLTIITAGLSAILICFSNGSINQDTSHYNDLSMSNCLKELKYVKYILLFVFSIAIVNEASYGITINLSQVHFESIGVNIAYLGLILAFCELLGMLSSKTYILTNKFGQYNTLKAMVMVMLASIFTLIFSKNILISIVCVSILSTFVSMIYPIVLDIQNKSINKNRATMLSIYSMFGNIFTSALNIVIGFGADISLRYGFIIYFAAMLFGIIGVFIYSKINLHSKSYKNKVV